MFNDNGGIMELLFWPAQLKNNGVNPITVSRTLWTQRSHSYLLLEHFLFHQTAPSVKFHLQSRWPVHTKEEVCYWEETESKRK